MKQSSQDKSNRVTPLPAKNDAADPRVTLHINSVEKVGKSKNPAASKFVKVGVNNKRTPNRIFTHSASVWSSPTKRNDPRLLPARLVNANFRDLVDLCVINGVEVVQKTLKSVRKEMQPMQYSIESQMLKNIAKGIKNARKN